MEEAFGIKALQAPRLTDYLRQYGLERVKGINATTRDKLASSLADGLEAGESTAQLVKRVQEHMPQGPGGACGVPRAERGPHKPAGREL